MSYTVLANKGTNGFTCPFSTTYVGKRKYLETKVLYTEKILYYARYMGEDTCCTLRGMIWSCSQ